MSEQQPANQAQPTPQAPQESAPVQNEAAAPAGKVEAPAKSNPDTRAVSGLKIDLFKAREKARVATDTLQQFGSRLEALEAALVSRAKPDESWGQPPAGDENGKDIRQLETSIVKKVDDLLSRREAESRKVTEVTRAKESATNWLLSREHLREDPKAVDEMAQILEHPKFAGLSDVDPDAAARSAYTYWCEQRGVTPDIGKVAHETPAVGKQPGGMGVPAPTTGISADSLKGLRYGTPEYDQQVKVLERAALEGKYKGKVIKI